VSVGCWRAVKSELGDGISWSKARYTGITAGSNPAGGTN
jgi:hypothetical protein